MAKYLNWLTVEQVLKNSRLTLFTPLDLRRALETSEISARFLLTRYNKRGAFVKLRRGLYALADNVPPEFEIANRLYQPSYISLTCALSYYHIIPEMAHAITSVTSRPTYEFEVLGKTFRYHQIKKRAFTGYRPEKISGKTILIAEKEKALVDYLYFTSRKRNYLVNERLALTELKKEKVFQYAKLFEDNRLFLLLKMIYA